DFALQAAVLPSTQQAMASLWDAGVVSFETMLADGPAGEAYVDAALLLDMLAQAAVLGARVGVYAGDQTVIEATLDRLRKAGRTAGRRVSGALAEGGPATGEALALARLMEARHATGGGVIARRVSTARGFEIVGGAKAKAPAGILVEVTPHHLRLDATALAR